MGSEADLEATVLGSDPDWPQVQTLQAGDDGALDVLMARHREGLFRFVYRYVLNHETAADLVQETFVRAYFKIGKFQPTAKFVTWLYRIALNLCRDHARSAPARAEPFDLTREKASSDGGERPLTRREPVSPGQNPSEAAASGEEVQRLRAAIDTLPHDLKTALILSAVESRSQKECAELLGTTPKTVETRVYRGSGERTPQPDLYFSAERALGTKTQTVAKRLTTVALSDPLSYTRGVHHRPSAVGHLRVVGVEVYTGEVEVESWLGHRFIGGTQLFLGGGLSLVRRLTCAPVS